MSKKPRNVLFITADQMRGDCLSLLKHPCIKTPNLDRLAAEGVVFPKNFANATPCAPSRACMHTGMYLHNHRLVTTDTPMADCFTNLALEARKVGYEPIVFGSSDVRVVGNDSDEIRPLPGFDSGIFLDDDYSEWRDYLIKKGYPISHSDWGSVFATKDDGLRSPSIISKEHSLTAFLTDGFIQYISCNVDTSWFAHITFASPHPPFVVSEPYHSMFSDQEIPTPVRCEEVDVEQRVSGCFALR